MVSMSERATDQRPDTVPDHPDGPDGPALMTIGAFSRASLLSVRSLRAYHDRGILIPAAVDPQTGYRAYHPGQLPDAVALRRLRQLDLPLPAIATILEARDPEVTGKLLAEHRAEMQARLTETERIVAELQRAVDEPGQGLPVHVRAVEHQYALSVTGRLTENDFPAFLGDAYGRLGAAVATGGFVPTGPSAALYGAEIGDDGPEPVTAYLPVAEPRPVEPGSGLAVIEIPALTVAVAVHEGAYATIGDTYAPLGAWVAYHARPTDAPVRELYLVSYDQTDDPDRFRTEIQWPIQTPAQADRPRPSKEDTP